MMAGQRPKVGKTKVIHRLCGPKRTVRNPANWLASQAFRRNHDSVTTLEASLAECEEQERFGGRGRVLALAAANTQPSGPAATTFTRQELNEILRVYGRKVVEGEWRDYAIDQLRERAVFSVFRRSSEYPLYRIVKQPRLARRQGAYSVVATGGVILKRGHDLAHVLKALEPRRLSLVEA
jgi:hypothetical protein